MTTHPAPIMSDYIVGNKYEIIKKLGEGAFGKIYEGNLIK